MLAQGVNPRHDGYDDLVLVKPNLAPDARLMSKLRDGHVLTVEEMDGLKAQAKKIVTQMTSASAPRLSIESGSLTFQCAASPHTPLRSMLVSGCSTL